MHKHTQLDASNVPSDLDGPLSQGVGRTRQLSEMHKDMVHEQEHIRIKNLDTGEYFELDGFGQHSTAQRGSNGNNQGLCTGLAPGHNENVDEEYVHAEQHAASDQPTSSKSSGAKGWLKGTKKLTKWAKKKIDAIHDKLEEGLERRHQHQLHPQLSGGVGPLSAGIAAGRTISNSSSGAGAAPPLPPQPVPLVHRGTAAAAVAAVAGGSSLQAGPGISSGESGPQRISGSGGPGLWEGRDSRGSSSRRRPLITPSADDAEGAVAPAALAAAGAAAVGAAELDAGQQRVQQGTSSSAGVDAPVPASAAALDSAFVSWQQQALPAAASEAQAPAAAEQLLAGSSLATAAAEDSRQRQQQAGAGLPGPQLLQQWSTATSSEASALSAQQPGPGWGRSHSNLSASEGPLGRAAAKAGSTGGAGGPGSTAGDVLRDVLSGPFGSWGAAKRRQAAAPAAAADAAVWPGKALTAGEGNEDEEDIEEGDDEEMELLPKARPPAALNQAVKTYSARGAGAPRTLAQVRLIQSVHAHDGVVWSMSANHEGSLLATGGQDGIVRVWSITQHARGPKSTIITSAAADETADAADRPSAAASQQPGSGLTAAALALHTGAQERGSRQQQPRGGTSVWGDDRPSSNSPAWQQQQQQQPLRLGALPAAACSGSTGAAPAAASAGGGEDQVLGEQPVRVLRGHREDVLALSWSRGSMLLSASVDCSVRLWHVGEHECLAEFEHPDFVACVQFHPTDARYFASGCADGRIRVWSVVSRQVVASAVVHHDMITALTFSPDGGQLVAGTLHGKCRYYEWQAPSGAAGSAKLEYVAQIDVKDRRAGASASGRKVTSITPLPAGPRQPHDAYLVASNDSRLRQYCRYTQECKYKGHRSRHTLVRASTSADGAHVLCGSDNGWAYVWDTCAGAGTPRHVQPHQTKNGAYECFQTDEDTITSLLLAPAAAWRTTQQEARRQLQQLAVAPAAGATQQAAGGGAGAGATGALPPLKVKRAGDAAGGTAGAAGADGTGAAGAAAGGSSDPRVAAALAAVAAAAADSPLLGAAFLVGGFSGRVLVYENLV